MRKKCLNFLCNNDLPDCRVEKQTKRLSRWYFCIHCLKYETVRYGCFYCGNTVEQIKEFPKFCSRVCKSRYNYNPKPSKKRNCVRCGDEYVSNMGYIQKYCSAKCRENKQLNKTITVK